MVVGPEGGREGFVVGVLMDGVETGSSFLWAGLFVVDVERRWDPE
jgi:hypothetical protein